MVRLERHLPQADRRRALPIAHNERLRMRQLEDVCHIVHGASGHGGGVKLGDELGALARADQLLQERLEFAAEDGATPGSQSSASSISTATRG
jgi:hypothetical protein